MERDLIYVALRGFICVLLRKWSCCVLLIAERFVSGFILAMLFIVLLFYMQVSE
jgi:hypothetical protein